jgi:toxin ParE1/3/4
MMPYEIKYLPASRQNLDDILIYLSEFYPSTPSKFISELRKCIENFRVKPLMYSVYTDFPIYRHIPVGDYIVFYIVNDTDRTVEIHRILLGKRNLKEMISNK